MAGQINGNHLAVWGQLFYDRHPGTPGAAQTMNKKKGFARSIADMIQFHKKGFMWVLMRFCK
jgi:hypothetical protein